MLSFICILFSKCYIIPVVFVIQQLLWQKYKRAAILFESSHKLIYLNKKKKKSYNMKQTFYSNIKDWNEFDEN